MTDCGRCIHFIYYQDTDDMGYAIAPPVEDCSKEYELYPKRCKDFKDAWEE